MIHDGHKGRLRLKALKDIEALQPHEVIELLLNYSIVRKNTNPLAHELIDKFGSISNIMDADISALLKVDGLGEVSASLLVLIPKICNMYNKSRVASYSKLSCPLEAINYFRTLLSTLDHEEVYALCLDKYDRIISLLRLARGNIDSVAITVKEAVIEIMKTNPYQVYLAHNHISESAFPSEADSIFTKRLNTELSKNDIKLTDHIIVTPTNTFSFRNANKFDDDSLI